MTLQEQVKKARQEMILASAEYETKKGQIFDATRLMACALAEDRYKELDKKLLDEEIQNVINLSKNK